VAVAFAERYPAEAADRYCLAPERADALLAGAPWRRFAVLGDSIAEGLREESPGYGPDSWADRLADALRRGRPGLEYVNLGRRDLRAAEIRDTQLAPALEFGPDLAAVVAGGNDLLARVFDGDAVEREIDAIVAPLRDAGADVITYSLFDMPRALDMPPELGRDLRERLDELFERTRAVARRRETIHVELAPHPASAERATYAGDFKHASTRGHAVCASVTIERLGERLGNA
jgi:lysophospholipase L1-like esterase